ncbi:MULTISPECIES: trypsin-like peptidase domain-containing protein [unclassified Bradyrhizobium]|uniref:NACHT domain-containing protein n=1 Tax=unclassified Bradyrhizobium TaxID=2631580 RepID=UPI0007100A2B|nr:MULTISPECIES: trypsin-like peptidase domain-containing protein [unclassified Bradyrhizobium]KQT21347.1 hypothetical protein ASG57_04295 [Bradyrhizobium sp. Leaf396]
MEFSRADDAHLRATVATIRRGPEIGTAFFAAPGVLITCEHVVRGATKDEIAVFWGGEALSVQRILTPPNGSSLDLAMIEVTQRQHPIVTIGPATTLISPVFSYGFQLTERGYYGYPSYGVLAGITREGNESGGRDLFHIVDALIAPGLSGAPLFSVTEKRVIGVVKKSRPERGGYAIPIEQIAELDPGFLSRSFPRPEDQQSPMTSYFRRVAAEHEFVSLLDLDRALRLDEIFVSLTLTRSGISGQRLSVTTGGSVSVLTRTGGSLRMVRRDRGSPQRFAVDESVSLFDVIVHSKAVIIGEPGCGKTTLLRHIVSRICKGELLRDRVPVFVKLSDIKIEVGCIENWLRIAQPQASSVLLEALGSGSCVLLLDGFDEAAREHHGTLVREVERLAASGNQILVTCRSVSLPRGLFSSDFRVFECIGFNVSQQRRFLRQWFSESPERASRLERQINSHAGVIGFARNPLLLSLMAVVAENEQDFRLPVNRTALYGKAIRALLERRATSSRSGVPTRRKLAILKGVASKHFASGHETFTEDALLEQIEEGLGRQRDADPDKVLHDLVEIDGVLTVHSPQRYRFLHLTFQEFLTAQDLVASKTYLGTLAAVIEEPRWEEVIRLTCGLLSAHDATVLIRGIWNPEMEASAVGRLLLAARAASDCSSLDFEHATSISVNLVVAMSGNARPNQSSEAEEALASLCRTYTGLLERVVEPLTRKNVDSTLRIRLDSFIRIMGMTADAYSAAMLRSFLQQLAQTKEPKEESDLALAGRVIEAIGQATLTELNDQLVEALSSASNYIRCAATRALTQLQINQERQPLLAILQSGTQDQKVLALTLLFSFQDQVLTTRLFEQIFRGSCRALHKAFAFHFNRAEIELDPTVVAAVWSESSDRLAICHIFSMHRCFLSPLLFSKLKLAAFTPDSDPMIRVAAIITLLKIESESIPSLVESVMAGETEADTFRAVLAAAPSARADILARSIMDILTESQRRKHLSAILRFVVANRVTALRPWVESVAAEALSSTEMRQCLLALASLGSSAYIDRARELIGDMADAAIPDRIIAYRGLGLMAHPTAREILLDRLEIEVDQAIVTEIILALGQQGDALSASELINLLDPGNWPANWPPPELPRRQGDQRPSDRRRLSIIFALEQGMNPNAVQPLAKVAAEADEDNQIREAALIASRNIEWGSGAIGAGE